MLLALLLAAFCTPTIANYDSTSFIAADNAQLQYTGRMAKNGSRMLWEWPGVGVAATLKCPAGALTVQVHISLPKVQVPQSETGTYLVLVDGTIIASLSVTKDSSVYTVNLPATAGNDFSLEVLKNSELMAVPIFWEHAEGTAATATTFDGITIPSSCSLSTPPPRPARRLEFIGDSITCGFGNDVHNLGDKVNCLNPLGSWASYENFSLGFASLLGKEFKAEMHTQCISNVGITRNGNTLAKTSQFNMSHYLHRILPTAAETSLQWDYKTWTPDLTVVNLGTNDYDLAQIVHRQPSFEFFESKYTSFLVDYVSRYEGRLPAMLVACGPMTKTQCPTVAKVAENVKAAFPALQVEYLELTLPHLGGCMLHPDSDGDVLLQKQMSLAISNMTHWDVPSDMLIV